MKTVITGKSQQLQECVDFAIERCKAHGFSLNCEQMKQGDSFSISSGNGDLAFSIYQVGNDLVVESKTKTRKFLILADPAPPLSILPFSLGDILGRIVVKSFANHILKNIHSEIEHRFS